MDPLDLLEAHRYAEAAFECRRLMRAHPNDIVPVAILAAALVALSKYREALPLFQRVHAHVLADEVGNRIAPGRPGERKSIACLHWMLGNRSEALRLMAGLVDGILDRSVNYGDIAGGVTQGLLLYYMGVTAQDEAAKTKALRYLRNRAKRSAAKRFPGPVARYYLGEIDFPEMLATATEGRGAARDVAGAIKAARNDLLLRRFVGVALFHDGVKARAGGDEAHCMMRMRECVGLENPLIEEEWYLARYETALTRGHSE
jgi:hypothetical protein